MELVTQYFPVIASLVLLEVILSVDNALVNATLAEALPPQDRAKAIKYGIIIGAIFRVVVLIFAVYIIHNIYILHYLMRFIKSIRTLQMWQRAFNRLPCMTGSVIHLILPVPRFSGSTHQYFCRPYYLIPGNVKIFLAAMLIFFPVSKQFY